MRTSLKEAARSGDSPPSEPDPLLYEALRKLLEARLSFAVCRSVFVLGSRLNASRRPLTAESNSESLAVASGIAATYSPLEGGELGVVSDGRGGRLTQLWCRV